MYFKDICISSYRRRDKGEEIYGSRIEGSGSGGNGRVVSNTWGV